MKNSFDMKCLQLAHHFLFDLQGKTRPNDANELAQAIQDVIESHCKIIEERPASVPRVGEAPQRFLK
jgi:hypothetical protein